MISLTLAVGLSVAVRPALGATPIEPKRSAWADWDQPLREFVIQTAVDFIGIPYRRGGDGRYGFDCSGFVHSVLSKGGFQVPRNSRDFYRKGQKINLQDARFGDLLFFRTRGGGISHVGIYLGDGRFIHSARRGGVRCDSLSDPYYRNRYAGATDLFSYPVETAFN